MSRELSADPGKLDVLLELQELLISEMIAAEQKIRALKSELRSLPDTNGTAKEQKRLRYLKRRIDRVQHVRYVWGCFGDAIAFTYLDRFSLKHTLYNTNNYNPKQDAGFIGGKDGLGVELAILKEVLSNGIPCMLVDLTNTIRYGDICLLTGPDPYLVEVKSSGKLDARARKQLRNLKKLHSFYQTDAASDFRGGDHVRRIKFATTPKMYADEFNDCISRAYSEGYAILQPEQGFFFAAIRDNKLPIDKLFENMKIVKPWVFSLNEFKSNRAWAPYYPFTLSIQSERALYDFIQGELYLLVLLDCDVLSELAAKHGYAVNLNLDDNEYPLRLTRDGVEGYAQISSHILNRSALEFLSPAWIIRSSVEVFERKLEELNADTEH